MVPVAKSNPNMAPLNPERGQISIFFSASLVVMISIIAFVINIGLFVKAKINLQNATDAAAYAGASVQSRQLSKMAYLNWDMRNIYKEWLYKYYVIGNLNIADVENPEGAGAMRFKLQTDVNVLEPNPALRGTPDPFNIPAVCIHIAGSQTNICKRYSVPGLPEFGSSNMPGAEEASRAFMDTLISAKVNDCIDRTRLNMVVANTWTYNVLSNSMDQSLAGQGPAILADRQGAWPRAIELAMRIRNLEFIMNRRAEEQGVCYEGTTNAGLTRCRKSIMSIEQERKLGNERLIKAFYTGYRNLGNEVDSEMKDSFTLSEIPPKPVLHDSDSNASNLLMPTGTAGGRNPREKQWVDLKLMMVNYAIFYAAMIPRADTSTSGACDISKVALPVPGYPMGFYKDPNLLTYYAVKGEAEFVGMFNPFSQDAIKMQAYAAAKPFGGRIGPVLFIQKPGQDFLVGRQDSAKYRSVPYLTTYDFTGVTVRGITHTKDNFIPGIPLPTNSDLPPGTFWLDQPGQPIGGKLADPSAIRFGIPNLVYDFEVPFETTGYSSPTAEIHTIKAAAQGTELPIGLFSRHQFKNFKGGTLNSTISPEELDAELARVRAPTLYEAANYLVPTPNDFNKDADLDSFGFISGEKTELTNGYDRYRANIYAPLYKEASNDQTDLLFENPGQVVAAIHSFMQLQSTGMDKYKMAMNRAALNIYKQKDYVGPGATGSADGYIRAANGVSDINFTNPNNYNQTPGSCKSLNGQFLAFYFGGGVGSSEPVTDNTDCPKPLGTMISEYFSQDSIDGFSPTYYKFDLSWKRGISNEEGGRLMTAYMPGPFTGVGPDGSFENPIDPGLTSSVMRRNTYSTKFIALDSLRTGGAAQWDNQGFPIYSEGDISTSANISTETSQKSFANPLEPGRVDADDVSTIKY
jgi:hypothetical protein